MAPFTPAWMGPLCPSAVVQPGPGPEPRGVVKVAGEAGARRA